MDRYKNKSNILFLYNAIRSTAIALIICLLNVTYALAQTSRADPEGATVAADQSSAGRQYMIVAAHPLAARAGNRILSQGGSAIDAAIAAQMVLNVVEPQSSGIGGGGFMLYWDAESKRLITYDGRETAPQSAKEDRFLTSDGNPMSWLEAVPTALSVGVPGLVAMFDTAHQEHGKLNWVALFEDAINYSRHGFGMSPRLNSLLSQFGAEAFGETAKSIYFDETGKPHPLGFVIKNETLAQTFETIAQKRKAAFYEGSIADAILERLKKAPYAEEAITAADLANYVSLKRPAVCIDYRNYNVCGMGPPSSGGLTVAQSLGILNNFSLAGGPDAYSVHLITEAEKLAYADRNRYIGDSDFVTIPEGYLDKTYLRNRIGEINPNKAMLAAKHGYPPMQQVIKPGKDSTHEASGTTHISVIDQYGNAVSMTTSIETAFGSRMMAVGFFLNNQLTDFSFTPKDSNGYKLANRPEPGKRPRSSMAPTIIFDSKRDVWAVLGSPGGSRIILYVLKSIIALIDWDMSPSQAAELGTFGSRNGPTEIEKRSDLDQLAIGLEALGHNVVRPTMTSGIHVIQRTKDNLLGGADPRREGAVYGN